jgi:microfibrillar-associated protein 1
MDEKKEDQTDNEKAAAERKAEKSKSNFLFMQKYYHKGAYYQDQLENDKVFQRDFHEPVDADRFVTTMKKLEEDGQAGVKALNTQMLRRGQFGKVGQVKHTHLAAEDTTDFKSPWAAKKRKSSSDGRPSGYFDSRVRQHSFRQDQEREEREARYGPRRIDDDDEVEKERDDRRSSGNNSSSYQRRR